MVSLACPPVSSGWHSQHKIFHPKKKESNPHHKNQKRPRQLLSKMVQGVPLQASTSKVTVLPVNVLTKICIFNRIDRPTTHLPTHNKEASLNHEAAKHDEPINHSISHYNTTSEHREYQNPYPECQNAWALLRTRMCNSMESQSHLSHNTVKKENSLTHAQLTHPFACDRATAIDHALAFDQAPTLSVSP